MSRVSTGICVSAIISHCLLCGCSKDVPRKSESPRTMATPSRSAAIPKGQSQTGEALFRQFCINCHPDGDNVSDPDKTLHGSVLRNNHITKPEDIVTIMRNPLSRMIRFDAETISDQDARAIAEYVLYAFK